MAKASTSRSGHRRTNGRTVLAGLAAGLILLAIAVVWLGTVSDIGTPPKDRSMAERSGPDREAAIDGLDPADPNPRTAARRPSVSRDSGATEPVAAEPERAEFRFLPVPTDGFVAGQKGSIQLGEDWRSAAGLEEVARALGSATHAVLHQPGTPAWLVETDRLGSALEWFAVELAATEIRFVGSDATLAAKGVRLGLAPEGAGALQLAFGSLKHGGRLDHGTRVERVLSFPAARETRVTSLHAGSSYRVNFLQERPGTYGDAYEFDGAKFVHPAAVELRATELPGVEVEIASAEPLLGRAYMRDRRTGRCFRLGEIIGSRTWIGTETLPDGEYDVRGMGDLWWTEAMSTPLAIRDGEPGLRSLTLRLSSGGIQVVRLTGAAPDDWSARYRDDGGAFRRFRWAPFEGAGDEPEDTHASVMGNSLVLSGLRRPIEVAFLRHGDRAVQIVALEAGQSMDLAFLAAAPVLLSELRDRVAKHAADTAETTSFLSSVRVEGPLFGQGWLPIIGDTSSYSDFLEEAKYRVTPTEWSVVRCATRDDAWTIDVVVR